MEIEGRTKSAQSPAVVGLALGAAIALVLSALAWANAEGPDVWRARLALFPLIGSISLPAVLAIIGLNRRPALLAAALISVPASLISLAGATLPLLLPAAFYLVAYALSPKTEPRVPTPFIAVAALGVGVWLLFGAYSITESVCSQTVRFPNGRTVEKRVPAPQNNVLMGGPVDGGARVVEMSCSEVPTAPSLLISVAVFACVPLFIGWMSGTRRPKRGLISGLTAWF
ncbi:MAG: hypothetical protein M3280_08810 [Actinomycetota bacterium]|nr:hypothetical protein [Actinomycetota bacterium]